MPRRVAGKYHAKFLDPLLVEEAALLPITPWDVVRILDMAVSFCKRYMNVDLFPAELYMKRLYLSCFGYKKTIARYSKRPVLTNQQQHFEAMNGFVSGDCLAVPEPYPIEHTGKRSFDPLDNTPHADRILQLKKLDHKIRKFGHIWPWQSGLLVQFFGSRGTWFSSRLLFTFFSPLSIYPMPAIWPAWDLAACPPGRSQNWGELPMLVDSHPSIHRDLFAHSKDSHCRWPYRRYHVLSMTDVIIWIDVYIIYNFICIYIHRSDQQCLLSEDDARWPVKLAEHNIIGVLGIFPWEDHSGSIAKISSAETVKSHVSMLYSFLDIPAIVGSTLPWIVTYLVHNLHPHTSTCFVDTSVSLWF